MTLGYNSKLLKRCAEVIILSAPLFIMYPSFVIFRELIAVFADSDSISRGISLCEVFISVLYAFVFSFLVDNSWSNAIKDNRKLMPRSRYVPYWKRRNYMSGYEKRIKHVFSLFTISYMLTISITIIWYVCYANNDGTRLAILFSSIVACLFLFSLPYFLNLFENNSGNNPASITFLRMILILFAVIALILLLYWLEINPSELNTPSDNSAEIYSSFNFFL